MVMIDGEYSHSVTQGLARRAYKKSQKEPARAAGASSGGEKNGAEVLAAHGEYGAKKSFHAYDHGTHLSAHAHDHQTGGHHQRDHASAEEAGKHMQEHMGGGGAPYDEANEDIEKAGQGQAAPPDEDEAEDTGEIGGIG